MTDKGKRKLREFADKHGFSLRAAANRLAKDRQNGSTTASGEPDNVDDLFFKLFGVRPAALEEAVRRGRQLAAASPTGLDLVALVRDLKMLARLHSFRDDYAGEKAAHEEAISIAERLPTPLMEVVVFYRRARNEEMRQQWSAAEVAYRQTLIAADNAREDLAAAFVLGDLSRLYSRTGDAEPELNFARQALERYRKLGAVSAEDALREMGRRLEQGGPSAALKWSRNALGIFPEFGDTRAHGIYPRLGTKAVNALCARAFSNEPGPDLIAEMACLRVERGEPAIPLITRIADLEKEGFDIEARFEDFIDAEIDNYGALSE